jgi:hypothetical protein
MEFLDHVERGRALKKTLILKNAESTCSTFTWFECRKIKQVLRVRRNIVIGDFEDATLRKTVLRSFGEVL